MPEIRFQIEWPDGTQELCYSPSLIVKEYFVPGESYELADFVERSRTALTIASDRVRAKYGMPCGLALGQLRHIEETAARYSSVPSDATRSIKILKFVE
ncbi:MAG: MSMEG_0570 family nitrogen starvation response protein [Leptolyngbyaceae bacterium]|nr:MSMEG_0570 family nitrogen starvation response protein [Leptolyngbyaceae bacterium]